VLEKGDVLTLQVPGSGGMYPSRERDPDAVRRDVDDGVVSPEAAARDYSHAAR
jgi:N-methylhydantoinase B